MKNKNLFNSIETKTTKTTKIFLDGQQIENINKVNKDISLYYCTICLTITNSFFQFNNHKQFCSNSLLVNVDLKKDLIFLKLDGNKHRKTCNSLITLGSCLIPNKNNYSQVSCYNFYLAFIKTENQFKLAGFFSVQKDFPGCCLNSIIVFPSYRNKRIGSKLLQLSYCEVDNISMPERPWSIQAERMFRKYYKYKIVSCLYKKRLNIEELCSITKIEKKEVVHILSNIDIEVNNNLIVVKEKVEEMFDDEEFVLYEVD